MTNYTLFGGSTETVSGAGSSGGGTLGVHFEVTASCNLTEILLYSPSGQGLNGVPTTIGLYNYTTQTLLTSQAATWSNTFGTGWISASFTTPYALSISTQYMGVVYDSSATATWFIYNDASWGSTITNGPLEAPNTDGGQGWYNDTNSPILFPGTQLADYNWYLDVQVSTTSSVFSNPVFNYQAVKRAAYY